MSISVLRAIGTRRLTWGTFRTQTMCVVSENSKHCHSKTRKMFSSKSQTNLSKDPSSEREYRGPIDGYITVYRLPLAGKLAFINGSKHNQMRIMSIVAPISIGLSYLDVLSGETSSLICLAGIVLALKLHFIGILATNLIGFVYISPDMSTVQISYIDQKGARQEKFLPASEIVPLSETPSHTMDAFYSQVLTYSKQELVPYYKLSLPFGEITDIKRFTHIFGKSLIN